MAAPGKNRDFLLSAILLGLNILVSWQITRFPATNEKLRALGPDVFPWIINMALYVLCGILMLRSLLGKTGIEAFPTYSRRGWLNMAVIVLFCLLFVPAMKLANFLVWGVCMMFAIQYVLGERRIFYNLLFSVLFPAIIYVVFAYGLHVELIG